jgi:hypothetical protein
VKLKNQWYKAGDKETIGGIKCIKNSVSDELCLSGHHGEIWQINETTCKAVILSSGIAKRYLPESKWPINPGDEATITFPLSELSLWIERLGVTRNRSGMIRLANWFEGEE